MKTLIGGAVAAVLGLIGLAIFFSAFLNILAGSIPIGLLLGGCLAIYLGFDELKDTWKQDEFTVSNDDDADNLKKKLEELEKENAELKSKS